MDGERPQLRDASLRWTAETAAPETPEHERLDCALRVLRALGVEADVPPWLTPPRNADLHFGAWLGGRHDENGDRYKLYVEVADAEVPRNFAGDAVPARTMWRMAGLDPAAGVLELYGKLAKPEVWEIERLLAAHGLDASPAIALARQLTSSNALPRTAGFSLALAAQHRWDTTLYDALLGDDLAQHPGRHGMFGVGVSADGATWLQIGLRP